MGPTVVNLGCQGYELCVDATVTSVAVHSPRSFFLTLAQNAEMCDCATDTHQKSINPVNGIVPNLAGQQAWSETPESY